MMDEERRFFEGQAERFVRQLESRWYPEEVRLAAEYTSSADPVPFKERRDREFHAIEEGDIWGKNWSSGWFHLRGKVPESWRGRIVVALLNFGGEACVFAEDGTPVQGLSSGSVLHTGFLRDRYDLFNPAAGGEEVDLWIETAANNLFGRHVDRDPSPGDPDRFGYYEARIERMNLAVMDRTLWHLSLDARVLFDLMKALPEKSVRRSRLLNCLVRAADHYRDGKTDPEVCRRILSKTLTTGSSSSDLSTLAVGHAHIDTGWLWPVRETRRKCARTYSTQLKLIQKYPDYVFGASAPQHYQFVKEDHPGLYRKIKDLVSAGRWEVQGAMWVEADCNVTGGESFVRQILHGKNFFHDEFGIDVKNLWIPDVFGYSASLPQILKRAGVDFFVTQKISWSRLNHFPHHTFLWRGIDGSEVITHFPPEDTYNSSLSPSGLVKARNHFLEKDRLDEFLTLFGYGDGGGGPTEEQIEAGLRQRDLEGAPRVAFGRAQDMLSRLEEKREELAVWSGELYLELHRGTLTTQAGNKRMNRKLELGLRLVELLYSWASLENYPSEILEGLWKILLLNQFHDILPGSSIHEVYTTSMKEYGKAEDALESLRLKAGELLFEYDPDSLTLVNSLSYPFDDAVNLPESWSSCQVVDGSGRELTTQTDSAGTSVRPVVPPFSHLTLRRRRSAAGDVKRSMDQPAGETVTDPRAEQEGEAAEGPFVMENELVRYEFTAEGTLSGAKDKTCGREILDGEGNVLSLYHDEPLNYEAWDVDIFYENQLLERARLLSRKRIGSGPVRSGWELEFAVGDSSIIQRVFLTAGSRRLDFITTADWRERKKMLRVSFDTSIHAHEAAYDIQFGYLKRPTHRNTSWDKARFEVMAHRFADLSERDYGVALLNDCKYGHKVLDRCLDLNLLRSPVYPDAEADIGRHVFTYSLLPHIGSLEDSDVFAEAAKLNQGVCVLEGRKGGPPQAPVSLTGKGIVLETVKKAEKEKALVYRAYETRGCLTEGVLELHREGLEVRETNLMEWEDRPLNPPEDPAVSFDGGLAVTFRPFEIRTFIVRGL